MEARSPVPIRTKLQYGVHMTTAQSPTQAGSRLTAALERMWSKIQKRHPELPSVVIVIGTSLPDRWGHFATNRWTTRAECPLDCDKASHGGHEYHPGELLHEVFVSGAQVANGVNAVMKTLLHEAAHGLNAARGIRDTRGKYHNKAFRKTAEEVGLVWPANGTAVAGFGFSDMHLPEETVAAYADELFWLDKAVTAYAGSGVGIDMLPPVVVKPAAEIEQGEDERKPTGGRQVAAVCQCEKPRRIRGPRPMFEVAPIVCTACDEPFTIVE